MKKLKVKKGHVLIMKTVNEDMSSHHDSSFIYPTSGYVEAVDFVANDKCGNGIHGFIRGEGDGSLARFNKAKWIILSAIEADVIMLDGNVKFRNGEVVYTGSQQEVTSLMKSIYPTSKVIGCTATAGYKGTATAGDYGTATAGDEGTATAGYEGTATAGDKGTATAGYEGTATAGYKGTATAGYKGTATAGDEGTATAGNYGTATTGDYGTATAGYNGTATAGDYGILIILYWNGEIYIRKCAVVGENGIEPNVPYVLDANGNFIKK